MARTLNELAYYYQSSLNRKLTDDMDLDLRIIKSWIRTSRAIWIKNELNKGKPISETFIQSLGKVNLEVANQSEVDLVDDFVILRTDRDMPVFIERQFEPVFKVGPGILTKARYRVIPYERVPYIGNGRFDLSAIFVFLRNRRLYVITKGLSLASAAMRNVVIEGVLEYPEDAARFSYSNGLPCYTDSSAYPISEYLVGYMKDMIISVDFATFIASNRDEFNNARDDSALVAGLPKPGKNKEEVQ